MSGATAPLELYLSHSWRPDDVTLNTLVWGAIHELCTLSVDSEGRDKQNKAYYVNRMEYLIRQADAFVSVLAYRDIPAKQDGGTEDFNLKCSHAGLFELRLAERARKPRWVIYDNRTRFRPTPIDSDFVRYTAIDVNREVMRDGPQIRADATRWLGSLKALQAERNFRFRNDAAVLVDESNPDSAEVIDAIKGGLANSRFSRVEVIRSTHIDSEVISLLQASDLFVAEIGGDDGGALGIAHALFIPTIRFTRHPEIRLSPPRLLCGHPYGYQEDLIVYRDPSELESYVRDRSESMDEKRYIIRDYDSGVHYLRRPIAQPCNVFLSHNLPAEHASITAMLRDLLDARGIPSWEYRQNMESGADWQEKLKAALSQATHAVFIMNDDFEKSEACWLELNYLVGERKLGEGKVFPFLWGGRQRPTPALARLDHPTLPSDHETAARVIAESVVRHVG
jgi:hypothetical protein